MLARVIALLLTPMLLIGTGQTFAAPAEKREKSLIIMGGSALGLRNSTKQDAEIAFNAVLDETILNPDMKIHVSVFETTEELYAAFDRGDIDGIFGSPLEYQARMDQLGPETMALYYKNGGIKQSYVLIGRRNEHAPQLSELRNRKLTLAKFQDVEALYLNTLLLRNQLPEIQGFFSERLDAKNSNIAIMDVFFGKSDATVVRESEFLTAVELNPQIGQKLAILDKSPPYIPAVGGVRKTVDREKIKTLMQDIEKITASSKGAKILTLTQATSIETISRDEMRSVFDLIKEYESLKKSGTPKTLATEQPKPRTRDKRHAP